MPCVHWRNNSLTGVRDDPSTSPVARSTIMAIRCFSLVAGYLLSLTPGLADWSQWRGPDRNGVTKDDVRLHLTWGDTGPEKLWQSETFPQENGSGSVVTSGERAFVLVNWQEQVPTEQRRLDARVQNDLGVLDLAMLALADGVFGKFPISHCYSSSNRPLIGSKFISSKTQI